jgi:hypothetical protein
MVQNRCHKINHSVRGIFITCAPSHSCCSSALAGSSCACPTAISDLRERESDEQMEEKEESGEIRGDEKID